jgi:hypothetical protein
LVKFPRIFYNRLLILASNAKIKIPSEVEKNVRGDRELGKKWELRRQKEEKIPD